MSSKLPVSERKRQMDETGEDERITRRKKAARNVSLLCLKHWKKLSKASLHFISFSRFYFVPVNICAMYQVLEMHMSKGELSADS